MQTLYEQIGGKPTIEKLVKAFYRHVLGDSELAPFFKTASLGKLERMQVAFFSVALGGPEPEARINLYQVHQGLGIQVEHLTRFTNHLMATLKEIGVDEQQAQDVYQRIATHANDILGDTSVDG